MTTHFEGDDCEPDGHRAELQRLRASAPLFPAQVAGEAIPPAPSTSSRSDANAKSSPRSEETR